MKELILKETITSDEAEKLDNYYCQNIQELLEFNNDIIIKLVRNINETLGYSFLEHDLYFALDMDAVDAKIDFDESLLDEYLKKYQLMKALEYDFITFSMALGDYYFNIDKNRAKNYYAEVFIEGFDLTYHNYFSQLKRYLDLISDKKVEFLERLINTSPNKLSPSLDLIDTYLTFLVNLDKKTEKYLKFINRALIPAKQIVRDYQAQSQNRKFYSDTDEERNLCELLTLKMEYYVNKKDYIKAYELYNELSDEIGKSDCTRYYHARNKLYKDMIISMKEDYPELVFFDDTAYKAYEILEDVNNIKKHLNKNITLKNDDNQTFIFKVVDIYENEVTIVPILPLLGEGGKMFMKFYKEDSKSYLKNRLLD